MSVAEAVFRGLAGSGGNVVWEESWGAGGCGRLASGAGCCGGVAPPDTIALHRGGGNPRCRLMMVCGRRFGGWESVGMDRGTQSELYCLHRKEVCPMRLQILHSRWLAGV
jgi:hypothetical protein